ncbi:MAG: hypothetical protein II823_03180 [Kiritimatiellae bacterium]|nr:hypothetical protein [Kiritimatiellia bacterium]
MKKSFLVASLLIAGVVSADTTTVDTDYVLGVMPVSTASRKQVILSIPWVAEGTGGNIAVSNLVKTAGLPTGTGVTKLTWYNTSAGEYETWSLEAGQWKEASEVDPATKVLPQGNAVVLSTTGDLPDTVYVVGQVGTSATYATVITEGSAGKWFLLAPPCASTSAVDFNTYATFSGDCIGDRITVDGVNYFTYMNVGTTESPTYKWTRSKYAVEHTAMIPAGRGFWYQRAETNSGALTITWNSIPSAN